MAHKMNVYQPPKDTTQLLGVKILGSLIIGSAVKINITWEQERVIFAHPKFG